MEKNQNPKANGPRPRGKNTPKSQSDGHSAASRHPFSKWMRPTANAGKARRNWEEAEDESHWLRILEEAEDAIEQVAPREALGPDSPLSSAVDAHLFQEQGWALAGSVLSTSQTERLAHLGQIARNAGWPRVFAYLYEETWQILRSPKLLETLSSWLGDGYRQLPGLWFHQVAGVAGARGWGPHVDSAKRPSFDAAGRPDRITVWVPLVDVDATRSCIFVVPTNENTEGLAQKILHDEQMPMDMVLRLMHASQPLPCKAGSLVAWRPDVLHWGGIHQGQGDPRSALSLEFIRAQVPLAPDEELSLAAHPIPDFQTRLYLVARGLLAYGKSQEREPYAHSFLDWGESMYRRHRDAAMRSSFFQ